jgi:hypothetical protein
MGRPSVKDWEQSDELLNAGTKGWNALDRLPQLLYKNFPWTREFIFGFFVEDDLGLAGSKGWVHVKPDAFDVNDWNSTVGLRYAFSDVGGVLKFRENYLMYMPKDFRRRQVERQNQAYEDDVAGSLENLSYAHPDDPEYSRMKRQARDLSSAEVYRVQDTGLPDRIEDDSTEEKPRRGRPRKE